jgi:hypothetical protein
MNTRPGPALLILGAALLGLSACGADDEPAAVPATASTASTASTTATAAATPPTSAPAALVRTPELDAIGVIGHSGAMGADSHGDGLDVPENSWVTGTNPKVDSIYERLLAGHPALKDHHWNEAVSGSDAGALMGQAERLLTHEPVPDIVFIVSMDNDIACDGTDDENLTADPEAYGATVAAVVDYLQSTAPGVKIFFNETPFSVHQYDAAVMAAGSPGHIDWPGSPCDPVTDDDTIDPAGEAYQQQVFDAYYQQLTDICAQRTGCATDEGALEAEDFTASPNDLTEDLNHLTVSALAREAAVVWQQLPPAWK